jgi:hypothetical protein
VTDEHLGNRVAKRRENISIGYVRKRRIQTSFVELGDRPRDSGLRVAE